MPSLYGRLGYVPSLYGPSLYGPTWLCAEFAMCRVCYRPSLSCAEFVMCRVYYVLSCR